jgi:hypothetical protein
VPSRINRFDRIPNTQQASWFVDLNSAGRLDLNPRYQRRSIWNREFRRFFIDSVIRNYPTQAIFLEVEIDPDGPTTYRVLDGKQRLTSLFLFMSDDFTTPDSLVDLDLHNTYYSELPPDIRSRILSYKLTVESVENATPTELNEVFDRLNRNVARLNKQELRHAKYGGEFASKMESLADDDLWSEIGLVTPARQRRMLDVEYVSEFYIVCMFGIQDGKDALDEYYAMFDEEVPRERQTDKLFRQTRAQVEELQQNVALAETRFSNVADFYSLWAAIAQLSTDGFELQPAVAARSLLRFQQEIDDQQTERSQRYLLAARQGSNKRANREFRTEQLLAVFDAT